MRLDRKKCKDYGQVGHILVQIMLVNGLLWNNNYDIKMYHKYKYFLYYSTFLQYNKIHKYPIHNDFFFYLFKCKNVTSFFLAKMLSKS